MATTKAKLAEEILRILSGGNIGVATKFHPEEIKLAVGQVGNQLLKMAYFKENLPMRQLIPSGAAIATYEKNLVEQYADRSKTTLPAYPIKLPRGIGVYSIFPDGKPDSEFIPMESGQSSQINGNPILSDLSGKIGYHTDGLDVIFKKDITVENTQVFVTIKLVVLDFSQYDDWAILPLNPEYEFQIKKAVVEMYAGEPVADKLIDPNVKEQRGVPVTKQEQS